MELYHSYAVGSFFEISLLASLLILFGLHQAPNITKSLFGSGQYQSWVFPGSWMKNNWMLVEWMRRPMTALGIIGNKKACSELHEEHHTWLKWWSHTTWLEWHSNWVHGTFRGRRKAARKSSEACRNQSWHGCITGGFVDMAVPHGFPYSYWKNVPRVVHG